MSELIVFGRYRPGTSPLHHLDARTKLLLSLFFMIIVFSAQNFAGLTLCALFVLACYGVANIPLSTAIKSITPLIFMLVITGLLNIFFVQGGQIYINWGLLIISQRGLYSAGFIAFRLLLLLLEMSLVTLVTPTLDLTDAFERLFSPLGRLGVPTHELAMMMGLALRFLPLIVSEFYTIHHAQLSRGARFSLSPFGGGLTTLSALMVPLFTSAFRHANTLSFAMEARCYHGGPGRTRLHTPCLQRRDAIGLGSLVMMLGLVITSNIIF